MNISFEGKRILVTGADRGIGKELALRLSAFKGQVIAVSRTKEGLEKLQAEDPRIQYICADLRDWEATRKAVQSALPIDLLVNNAAIAHITPFFEATQQEFDESFTVNVKSILNVSQIVAKNMLDRKIGGSIVNMSSQASQAALQDHAVYCATKGAVDMLSKVMALELGPYNIRVNTVNPTVVMTEMGRKTWENPKKGQPMLSRIPMGRFAEINEVVDAVMFLLSDHSSMINGVALPVDGGFLAT